MTSGDSTTKLTRDVVVFGAPWCEGQNLEGADLAPGAMRDAGLVGAIRSLDLTCVDKGDIDFSTAVGPKEEHRYSIETYREWLSSATQHNFATWMRTRMALNEDGRGTKARKRSHDKALNEQARVNVLNAEQMGNGLRLIHEAIQSALLVGPRAPNPPFVLTIGGDHSYARDASNSGQHARGLVAHAYVLRAAGLPQAALRPSRHPTLRSASSGWTPMRTRTRLGRPHRATTMACLRHTCSAGSTRLARWAKALRKALLCRASSGSPLGACKSRASRT